VKEHGIPFMRSTAAVPELCRRLEERKGFDEQLAYRRPVALLLAGQRRRAREMLHGLVESLGDRDDLAAAGFRRFATALGSRLDDA
jgi:hypothetical protein